MNSICHLHKLFYRLATGFISYQTKALPNIDSPIIRSGIIFLISSFEIYPQQIDYEIIIPIKKRHWLSQSDKYRIHQTRDKV